MNITWNVRGQILDFTTPRVMGILNVTPDSFYDGGRYADKTSALRKADQMLSDGADLIDVGGYSSRPGAADIPVDEEIRRTVPVIREIRKMFPAAITSIDTFRSEVARQALDEGASVLNDITGGAADPKMADLAARHHAPYVVMHMRGTPETMNRLTGYEHLVRDVVRSLRERITQLTENGVKDVAVDPGFGFAKTVDQNFELLARLDFMKILERPVMVGLSRKSMIWKTLGGTAETALNGTTALNMASLLKGASILRVHDVKEAKECVRLFTMMNRAE